MASPTTPIARAKRKEAQMTDRPKQVPDNCKHYANGTCGYQSQINRHACCLRIVKPMAECFYFTPKKK